MSVIGRPAGPAGNGDRLPGCSPNNFLVKAQSQFLRAVLQLRHAAAARLPAGVLQCPAGPLAKVIRAAAAGQYQAQAMVQRQAAAAPSAAMRVLLLHSLESAAACRR
jgi:demethoxyubiquinone hydroxylase (CLK1/Coq7/Cat5 family)